MRAATECFPLRTAIIAGELKIALCVYRKEITCTLRLIDANVNTRLISLKNRDFRLKGKVAENEIAGFRVADQPCLGYLDVVGTSGKTTSANATQGIVVPFVPFTVIRHGFGV